MLKNGGTGLTIDFGKSTLGKDTDTIELKFCDVFVSPELQSWSTMKAQRNLIDMIKKRENADSQVALPDCFIKELCGDTKQTTEFCVAAQRALVDDKPTNRKKASTESKDSSTPTSLNSLSLLTVSADSNDFKKS